MAKREAPSPPGLVRERVLDFWNADHWSPGTTSQVAHCSLVCPYVHAYEEMHGYGACTRTHLRYSWGPTNRDKRRPRDSSQGVATPLLHCTCSALSLGLNYCRERGREGRGGGGFLRVCGPVLNAFQNGR